eukprot:363561-Chlamydomonas_euryale.AAC.1
MDACGRVDGVDGRIDGQADGLMDTRHLTPHIHTKPVTLGMPRHTWLMSAPGTLTGLLLSPSCMEACPYLPSASVRETGVDGSWTGWIRGVGNAYPCHSHGTGALALHTALLLQQVVYVPVHTRASTLLPSHTCASVTHRIHVVGDARFSHRQPLGI